MPQFSEQFVPQAPVLLVKPNGITKAYGLGATTDAARYTALFGCPENFSISTRNFLPHEAVLGSVVIEG